MDDHEVDLSGGANEAENEQHDTSHQRLAADPDSKIANDDSAHDQDHANDDPEVGVPAMSLWQRFRNWRNDPYRPKAHWSDLATIGLTITLVAVGATQACIYYQQKQIMESSGHQTDQLITYAKAQACAAKSFADSASNINSGIGTAVGKLNLQAEKLEASVRQAERLAKATEEANANVVNSDRPWMGTSFGVDSFASGATPTYTVVFTNSGKRPARVMLTQTMSSLVDYGNKPVYPSYDVTPSISVAVPGQPLTTTWKETNTAMNPISDVLLRLLAAGGPFRVYANIEYTDIRTDIKYWTHACWRYTPNQSPNAIGFSNCPEYNDAK